jgi:hypothetical protein
MVILTLREILKGKSYKTIFNYIYKTYLKDHSQDKVINISIEIHNLIKKLRSQPKSNNDTESLIITELEDDKYDVNILQKENDEILSLDNLKANDIIDLEVLSPIKLNDIQILGNIIWHYYERGEQKVV